MSIEALLKPTVLQGLGINTNPLVPPANNSTQTTLNNINNFANHSKFLLDVLKNKDNSTPTFTASTIGESIFSPVNNLSDFKTIGNSLGNSLKTGWGSIVGGILDRTADQDRDINSVDYTTKHIRNGLTDLALSSGNPIAMGVGSALKFIDKTGGFMDSSKGLGGLADVGNAIGSFIPGFGWLGRTTNELEDSQTVAKSSSYANLRKTEDFEKAQNNSNGTFLFGTGKANAIINEQNRRMNLAENILDHNKDVAEAANNSIQLVSNRLAGKRNGLSAMMVGPNAVRAKCGAKLYNHINKKSKPSKKKAKCEKGSKIQKETKSNKTVTRCKNGGNIIPAGALHARKNNLDKADESLKDSITNKGIPVITRNDDGSITQHAEIEHSEIIFNLNTTNKLEEYLSKYNEAKSNNKPTRAIELECGKFLCNEILKNTTDKVGLIKSIK